MTYKEELIAYLKNTGGNLAGEYTQDISSSSDAFGEIMGMASSKDSDKKLLSIILFQQITIELMKRLIIHSNFLERLCLYPNKKVHKKIPEDAKFSEVMGDFKASVEFKNKKKLIADILKINSMRNKYAHRIAFQHNIYNSSSELEKLNPSDFYQSIFSSFVHSISDLRKKIESAKNSPEIEKLVSSNEK